MRKRILLVTTLVAVGLISGCGGDEDGGSVQGGKTPVPSKTPETFGEFLVDVEADNVERVVVTANNNVKVTRRNGDGYELGRFAGVRGRRLLLETVPALRSKGVAVEVEGRPRSIIPDVPPTQGQSPRTEPTPKGTSARDQRMAFDVVRYFRRNFRGLYWYGHIELVRVERGVITIVTDLAVRGNDRFAAMQICDGIQGSDVADFTPGHTVRGRNDLRFRCPARTD
jgi:hypothetical protein